MSQHTRSYSSCNDACASCLLKFRNPPNTVQVEIRSCNVCHGPVEWFMDCFNCYKGNGNPSRYHECSK